MPRWIMAMSAERGVSPARPPCHDASGHAHAAEEEIRLHISALALEQAAPVGALGVGERGATREDAHGTLEHVRDDPRKGHLHPAAVDHAPVHGVISFGAETGR